MPKNARRALQIQRFLEQIPVSDSDYGHHAPVVRD
jgi:hypothetical protein